MALVGVELQTLVSEPEALTTRPPPCDNSINCQIKKNECVALLPNYLMSTQKKGCRETQNKRLKFQCRSARIST